MTTQRQPLRNASHRVLPIRLHEMKTLPLITLTMSLCFAIALHGQDSRIELHEKTRQLPTDQLGPFVHTSTGDVLAIDSDSTFISEDGGKTWSHPRPLKGASEMNLEVSNERALLRTRSGAIIAAFMNLNERKWTWDNRLHDAPGATLPTWAMRSTDDGETWGHVQKLHSAWSGAVRDMIQTSDGTIVFTAMKMQHDPGRHAVLTYSSTDDGKTWKPSNLIDLGGKGHHGGVTEPTLTELPDGTLWMLIRTNWGQFWSAYSYDGGRFWRTMKPSGIPAGSAPGLIKRLESGRMILVWNRPFPEGKSEWKLSGGDGLWSETPVSNFREELSVAFSDDDGKTWTDPTVIARVGENFDPKKRRWIAYPYLFEHKPGELWLTTMQGGLRAKLLERDFAPAPITVGRNATKPDTKAKTIVAFGDSTTAVRGELRVYPTSLQQAGVEQNWHWHVVNAGVGGNHTDNARGRFETDVLHQNPTAVIIQFGINDAAIDVWKTPPATEPRVSIERFEKNLQYFIDALRKTNCDVILMTPNPLTWTDKLRDKYGKPPYKADDPDGFNVMLSKYAESVRRIAKSKHVTLIDVEKHFREHAAAENQSLDDLLIDGMHPNEKGHRIIASQLLRALSMIESSDQ